MTAPDGTEWRVGRQWLPRRPRLRNKDDDDGPDGGDFDVPTPSGGGGSGFLDAFDDLFAIILVVGAVLLVVAFFATVVFPVLVIAIELILLLVLFLAGLAGRVLLGRPWTVRARNSKDKQELRWAVRGFRRSGEARDAVAAQLAATGRAPESGASLERIAA